MLPSLRLTRKQGLGLTLGWFVADFHWLFWAYRLEFLGENSYFQVWLASILFFGMNLYILAQCMSSHDDRPSKLLGDLSPWTRHSAAGHGVLAATSPYFQRKAARHTD